MDEHDASTAHSLPILPAPARRPLDTATEVTLTSSEVNDSLPIRSEAGTRSHSAIPIIHRRRTDITAGSALPKLALDLETIQEPFTHPPPTHSYLQPTFETFPTASIAIPARTLPDGRPITPLSGRPRNPSTFETVAFNTSKVRRYSSSSASQASSDMSPSPPRRQPARPIIIDPRRRQAESAPYGHTSSPLSPGTPRSAITNPLQERQQRVRRPQQSLNLAGLPKFHPANFHNVDSRPLLSPQSTRHVSGGSRSHRRGSDAQQRLHQYQRDAVASYTKHILSPKSPRLGPQESPGTRITPLALETAGDYLMAGSTLLPPPTAASARDLVENLIQQENAGRSHPEARSGSASPAYSPSVSPAISPAGGCI